MVDPVIAADGITYEKTAAVEWLKDHDTSPINPGMKISVDVLIENIVLRNQIEDFVASPECPEDMKEEYEEKKNRGKKLFKEGKVLEAANLGYLEAMGKMAMNYGLGEGGFNVDKDKAFEFATKAANAGDKGGQFQLARCYHLVIGVQQDNAAALTWYQRCIEKGCGLGAVNNNMGNIYEIGGHGVEKNFDKAAEYFRIAADLGDDYAQCNLAGMYFDGVGVEQSFTEARKWYKLSADQNDADAQLRLGQMMMQGKGGEKCFSQGIALIEESAKQGNAKAMEWMKQVSEINV